jgi:hypothetical protein
MFKRHIDNRILHFKFKTLLHPQQIVFLNFAARQGGASGTFTGVWSWKSGSVVCSASPRAAGDSPGKPPPGGFFLCIAIVIFDGRRLTCA